MARYILFSILSAAAMFGGGFNLEFGNPDANNDPRAKDAAVVVRAVGCHSPDKAAFVGTAEGLVNGKRKTIPLKLVPLSQPGVFAVPKQWPSEGSWALTFSGSIDGVTLARATVPVSPKGVERLSAKNYHRQLTEADIVEAIH